MKRSIKERKKLKNKKCTKTKETVNEWRKRGKNHRKKLGRKEASGDFKQKRREERRSSGRTTERWDEEKK